jgi:hypothetical protein
MHSALTRSARSTMILLPCICDGGETKGTKQQVGGGQIKPVAKIPVNQPKKKRAAHRKFLTNKPSWTLVHVSGSSSLRPNFNGDLLSKIF